MSMSLSLLYKVLFCFCNNSTKSFCKTQNVKANILQFLFLNYDDMVFGSCASRFECSFFFQVIKLNSMMLEKGATAYRNIFLIDLNSIQNEVGRSVFYDPKLYYIGKIPVSLEALPYVAQRVTSVISAMMGRIKKCVVLDLDNTLWGGAIGDDGMEGIQIGELGLGHAYQDFQRWLRELRLMGVLLAVCSKNNEETAKEPFLKHPEMILQLDDISLFVANWQDKVTNIRYIQRILNIGMDSMVFIDDNPFERNLVRDTIPEITVPELPDDSSLYLSYLQGLDLFGTASYSDADKERTRQYQEEVGRIEQRQKFASLDDYLKSLGMVANVRPFDSFSYPRIAQLTQRSNQFNLRTIRYTDEDIARIARDQKYLTLEFFLDDKYGSNGLVSAIIMEKRESGLFIDTWLMSCRVLKRGMEEFIINKVIDVAEANGFKAVFGEYIRTPKNSMVEKIYSTLGFKEVSENRFEVIVGQFRKNKTYIQEKGE